MGSALGIDVGGTKIAAGLLHADGSYQPTTTRPTAGAGAAVVAQLRSLVAEHLDGDEIDAVGIAVPGPVLPGTGVLTASSNLGWLDVDLALELGASLPAGVALTVENDGNAAAWAEYRFANPDGVATLVLLSVRTGLGGGVVVNGSLLRGRTGAAGELGHLTLVPDGLPCGCGNRGCWEQYVSGTVLRRIAEASGWPDAHAVLQAASHDPAAADAVGRVAGCLVQGLNSLVAVLDPGEVRLGGGLGTDPLFVDAVQRAYAEAGVHLPVSRVPVRAAALGPAAGSIGAADLARIGRDGNR